MGWRQSCEKLRERFADINHDGGVQTYTNSGTEATAAASINPDELQASPL